MILVRNGRVLNPAAGMDETADILIQDGNIKEIASAGKLSETAGGMSVIDAGGMIVAPGLVDVHVHFRDPGFPDKEDIESGAAAAARGGFTTVVLMANTKPAVDDAATLRYVLEKGAGTGIHIRSCACVTRGMQGAELVDMELLAAEGAVGFTDDGIPLLSAEMVRKAMITAGKVGRPLSFHEEDPAYIKENGINAGAAAGHLGIGGSDRRAEIEMVRRDLKLAEETGAVISIQHVSTGEAVALIRAARAKGVNIHAEATPHHFTLTEAAVLSHGSLAKMNPPLRTERDRLAIIEGLRDGTIDMIATDHAPHTGAEKERLITAAPSGIIGLETALSLGIRELVDKGYLSMMKLIECMSTAPAGFYQLPAGDISVGCPADLVIFDPVKKWRVDHFYSRSANSPFRGEELPGVVETVICAGRIVYRS